MFKSICTAAFVGGTLAAGSIALAAPASATQAKCSAYANTNYAVDLVSAVHTDDPKRCTITNQTAFGTAVPSGTIDWTAPEERIVEDSEYTTEDFAQGELVETIHGDPVFGEWAQVGSEQVTVSSPQKVGKSTNTKTTTTTVKTFERTVSTDVTYVYATSLVTVTLADVETFREGSESSVKTATRTVRVFSYNNGGNVTGAAPAITTTSPTEAGEAIEHEESISTEPDVVQDQSSVEIAPTVENGGVVTETTETVEQSTVTIVEACVENKNKSKNRQSC